MKIFGSTQYVDHEKETGTYYQLNVISQWDWSTKTICYNTLKDGFIVKLSLRQYNPYKFMLPEDITDEIKEELIKLGYTL